MLMRAKNTIETQRWILPVFSGKNPIRVRSSPATPRGDSQDRFAQLVQEWAARMEAEATRRPERMRPALKIPPVAGCRARFPKSLSALLVKLNHGERAIEIAIEMPAVRTARV